MAWLQHINATSQRLLGFIHASYFTYYILQFFFIFFFQNTIEHFSDLADIDRIDDDESVGRVLPFTLAGHPVPDGFLFFLKTFLETMTHIF